MSDITKCKGNGCPIKNHCHRFTSKEHSHRQSYFTSTPLKIIESKGDKIKIECEMYWGKNQDQIMDFFHQILKS
jgi:hypothetical protein